MPGTTSECECGEWDEYTGTQKCGDGGTYGECECPAETPECIAQGDTCEGGRCFQEVRTEDLFCAQECITVGDPCEAGGCYYIDSGNYCFAAGTKIVGEACGAAAECVVGVQCLDNGGMFCWQVCADSAPCDEQANCEDTGLGFSVCVAGE